MASSFIFDAKTGLYTLQRPVSPDEILSMARQITRRRFARRRLIQSPAHAKEHLSHLLAHFEHEVFCCLFLDNKHRVLAFEEMFRGTIDGASVHPREVVKQALKLNAAAVILVHNHPSGVPEPSRSDEQITQRLKEALALVDVRVLDHFVIGGDKAVSFSERGLL